MGLAVQQILHARLGLAQIPTGASFDLTNSFSLAAWKSSTSILIFAVPKHSFLLPAKPRSASSNVYASLCGRVLLAMRLLKQLES